MFNKIRSCYYKLKIRKKLFVILSIQSLSIFVVCIIALQLTSYIYNEQLFKLSSDIANITSITVDTKLKEINRLSYSILSDRKIQDCLKALKIEEKPYESYRYRQNLEEKLIEYSLYDNTILSINIIDTCGREYSHGISTINLKPDRVKQIIETTAAAEGRDVWIGPDIEDKAVICAKQLRTFDNLSLENLGTLVIRIDAKKLLYNNANSIVKNKAAIAILLQKNSICTEYDNATLEKVRSMLDSSKGYNILNISNQKYMVTSAASEYTDWMYVNIVPYESIFSGIIVMRNAFILVSVCIFICVVYMGLRFVAGITNPIEELSDRVKTIQDGNFDIEPVSNMENNDEIGVLGKNFVVMVEKINVLINDNYKKELLLKETEIAALQAQINPHFLYNTLESINWMAKLQGQNNVAVMIQSLGELLRNSISNKRYIITVEEDIVILNSYIAIQKHRYEERLDFTLNVSEEFFEYAIPKFTLQPIVENSIKYALEDGSGVCRVNVYTVKMPEYYEINIVDNGPGIDEELIVKITKEEIKSSGSGIGLKNINDRIKMLLGKEYGLTISNGIESGTKICIKLPYE